MNTERLHIIAIAVQDDLRKTETVNLLNQLVTNLKNQISQPQQAQHQQQLSQTRKNLDEKLSVAPSNGFSPTWEQAIEELHGEGLLGEKLRLNIEEVFSKNQITLSAAAEELSAIHKRALDFSSAIDHIVAGFGQLGVGKDDLSKGECELGILIPRKHVENRLENFGKELEEVNQIFGVFSELATGSRGGFTIRQISSSELTVFLDLSPKIAACVAVAVERLVALYKQILEIRKLHNELKAQRVPLPNLKGVEEHAGSVMEKGIEEIIPKLMEEFYSGKDHGRKNEIIVELKISMKKIANRIDRGFNIEVRAEPTEEPQPNEKGAAEENSKPMNYLKIIQEKSREMQFLKKNGDPILSLPESEKPEKKGK